MWPLWAALALAIGIAVLAYGLESSLLSAPVGLEQVTVVRMQGGSPQDEESPAHYYALVTRADGTKTHVVSQFIHQPGDKVVVHVLRGRLTGRIWLFE
jgi:hypothetical protein